MAFTDIDRQILLNGIANIFPTVLVKCNMVDWAHIDLPELFGSDIKDLVKLMDKIHCTFQIRPNGKKIQVNFYWKG